MQRSIVAALVALSLGACSSDNDSTSNIDGSVANTPNAADLPILSDDPTAVVIVAEPADESESAGDAVAEPVSNETPVNDSTGNGGVVPVDNSSTNDLPTNTDDSGQSGNSSNVANDAAEESATTDASGQNQENTTVFTENNQGANAGQNTDSATGDDAASATSDSSETAAQNPATDNSQNNATAQDTGAINDDAASAPSDGGENAAQNPATDNSQNDATGQNTGTINDDAASAPSDGGENAAQNPATDNSQADAAGQNTGAISDDAASAPSDGGENATQNPATDNSQADAAGQNTDAISDDAASATSDGGETPAQNPTTDNSQNDAAGQNTGAISDDAASATSDGGETASENTQNDAADESTNGLISDDAASATSDGGQVNADDASGTIEPDNSGNGEASNGDNAAQAAATDFESNNTGGAVLRRSALGASEQVNICSTASDQQNFSDTRIGDFILHNNVWRPGRAAPGYEWIQCITTNTNGALAGWNYDWGPGISGLNGNPSPSGDFYVRSYPELIYGVKDEFRTSAPKAVTGLPVELSELPNITIDYSYDGPQFGEARTVTASNNPRFPNGSTISGERNVAVESFLYIPDANGECSEGIVTRNGGSNHVYEVMVWLDAGAERLPAGPSEFVTDVNIRGEAFKVYTKASDNRYVAFVAQNPQTSGTLVWNDFTDWAKTYAHRVTDVFGAESNSVQIQDSWCVANIIVGTEIFWGAGNLDLYNWTITQSR